VNSVKQIRKHCSEKSKRYERVLSETHTNPHEIIHIGDSLRNDVSGAQSVGIRAIWLNRHQQRNETSVQPFAEIISLEELPKVLTQYVSSGR
jgi:FMN phosphatase YigB (HAD superfamily)